MNCPLHPIRQLSERGYCIDCGSSWAEPVLNGYALQYSWAKSNYEEALLTAKQEFETKIGELRLKAKKANKKLLGANKQ